MSRIISIEGNIGTGKSTFVNYLKTHASTVDNCIFLEEPLSIWQQLQDEQSRNILQLFYTDKTRWTFTFQLSVLLSRIQLLMDTIKEHPTKTIVIERSICSDRNIFAKLSYSQSYMTVLEWNLYNSWFDMVTTHSSCVPTEYVYLHTDPETCYSRMVKRSRTEESEVSLEYIHLVHNAHTEWLKELADENKYPVHTIDFTRDMDSHSNLFLEMSEEFYDTIINRK